MRLRLRLACLAPLLALPAAQHHQPTPAAAHGTMGVHGMVLFGGADGLYASHLPLYRAPHDRQLLLELRIADPAVDRALRRRLAARPALWTIAPERFELDRLDPASPRPLRSFTADLVEGHFERGGRPVYRQVRLEVARILDHRMLDAAAPRGASAEYQLVGRGRTLFLVRRVAGRPEFDHIVALRPTGAPPAARIAIPAAGVAEPSRAALARAVQGWATVAGTVYYDAEDLR